MTTPAPAPPVRPRAAAALAVLCGVLVFTSFPFSTEPDSNLWGFGWFALVPLLVALEGRGRRAAFRIGWLAGFVTNFGGFWWISEVLRDFGHLPPVVAWPVTALNAAYQGLVFAVFAALLAPRAPDADRPRPGVWRVAATFTVVEWCFPLLFPWFMGNGQYRFLPAIQVAELGGVPAVTLVMLLVNASLFSLVQAARAAGLAGLRGAVRGVVAPLGVALGAIVYGLIRLPMVEAEIEAAEKLKLGLVEANIGIFEKEARHLDARQRGLTLHRNLLKHQWMSKELADAGVDLVIWPESSYFPITDPAIKRTDRLLLAGSADGAVLGGDTSAGVAPSVETAATSGASVSALAAAREGAWLGAAGARVVTPSGPVEVEGAPALQAVALIPADGRQAERPSAPLEAILAGEGGFLAAAPYPALRPLRRLETARGQTLRAAAATPDGGAWLVGDGGLIVEVRRGRAEVVESPVTTALRAVTANADGAWAVGDGGVVLTRGPRALWERVDGPGAAETLTAVAVDAAGDVWAGGPNGLHARRAGSWTRRSGEAVTALALDGLGRLHGLLGAPPRLVRLGADGGVADVAGWPSGLTSLSPDPWVQADPFPRDTRWVRQSRAPLPPLEAFDASPEEELHGQPPAELAPVQRGFTAPILFGGLTWAEARADAPPGSPRRVLYNTALLLGADGQVLGTYDKVHLLAFGEYLPFGELFPELYDALPQAGRFTPGEAAGVIPFRGHRLGLMICYEDILASFTADLARERPNIILNVTNDAWFGRTSEPHLHLALAVFRAVENRLVLVRSTNTGVSAVIEPTGLLRAQTRIDDPETLVADVAMLDGGTPYSATGHAFAWLLLAALLWGPARALWARRRAAPES